MVNVREYTMDKSGDVFNDFCGDFGAWCPLLFMDSPGSPVDQTKNGF